MIFKSRKQKSNNRVRRVSPQDRPTQSYNYRNTRLNTDYSPRNTDNVTSEVNPTKKSKRSWLYHIPSLFIAVIIGFSLIYAFTLNDNNPKVIVVDSAQPNFLQPLSVYKSAASKILSSSIFNRSKLTIDTDDVAAKMTKQFPELVNVSVVIPIVDHNPIVEIQPAVPVAVLSNKEGSFVVDQQGGVVSRVEPDMTSELAGLPVVTDQSGLNVKIGEQVLSTTNIQFITTLIDQFKAKSIQIQSVTLAAIPYELNVQLTGDPYYIKFNLQGSARLEVGTFIATINELTSQKVTPSSYVDVRVAGRAYYK